MGYYKTLVKNKKYVNKMVTRNKLSSKTKWLILLVVVVIVGLGLTYKLMAKPADQVITQAGNPTPPGKNNQSVKEDTKKSLSQSDRNIGGASDSNGTAGAPTTSNQWIVSKSGNITVKQPLANNLVKPGFVLSGSAKVQPVQFRLIDDKSGVISQGTLNVVSGNFSGTINFTATSSSGRLDVFSVDSQGVELNEVQIAVRY